ncbi:COG4223 family protein [Puniceibacterium confluentis]|uniref:COG4223 family protein n=1 Tax=Puniceibacterium confluentis TaxID=1958944 RepID=UPI0011B73477|nr:mitofilin family membrane protein [Puniceibacterium confluentis]
MADGKKSKDTRDQSTGADGNSTKTADVSTSQARTDITDTQENDVVVQKEPVAEPSGSKEAADAPEAPEVTKPDEAEASAVAGDGSPEDTSSDTAAAPWSRDKTSQTEDLVGAGDAPEAESAGAAEVPPAAMPLRPAEGQVIKETVVQRKGGFFPMLLGGVAAGVIGYGVAQYQANAWPFGTGAEDPFRAQTIAALEQQRSQLDDLAARLGNTETAVGAFDVSDLTTAVSELRTSATETQNQIATLSDQIGRLEVRVVELEKRPMEAALSPEAVAAYEREMDSLRSDIASQRNEIMNFAAEAVAAEQSAEAQASLAKVRAALAELTTSLESGAPFEQPLATIRTNSDVDIPPALSSVAGEGVPTMAELGAEYPDAARAALAAARAEAAPAEGTNHVLNFFRDQVGARSVTPREGSDADAVLSRAEAALTSGDLAATLAEVRTLSGSAQSAMADWMARAEARVSAQGAAATLAQELNQE